MDEQVRKAFDFAQDTTKQLLTLSTAIITITISFTKDIVGGGSHAPKVILGISWAFDLLSAVAGILTLMALTGSLSATPSSQHSVEEPSVRTANVTRPAKVQALCFLVGLILTITAGVMAL